MLFSRSNDLEGGLNSKKTVRLFSEFLRDFANELMVVLIDGFAVVPILRRLCAEPLEAECIAAKLLLINEHGNARIFAMPTG